MRQVRIDGQLCQQFPLSIDEENIDIVDTHKHLGVILSTDLKWKAHLESILAKARKRAGLLRHVHVSHQLPAKLTCHLYLTYVRPMIKAVAKGPILRPWPDQFEAKKKKKVLKRK